MLKQRLEHLERKGVVTRVELSHGRGHEYQLTPAGRETAVMAGRPVAIVSNILFEYRPAPVKR